MIKWKRLASGEYESQDKRFYILQSYDRIYGNHWVLRDKNIADYYKQQYHENTLKDCKIKAETLLENQITLK